MRERIAAIKKSLAQSEKEIAELEEFADAFKKVSPKADEFSELDNAIARLSSVEELRIAAQQAISVLDEEESGVISGKIDIQ